jgi:hypothetical protein
MRPIFLLFFPACTPPLPTGDLALEQWGVVASEVTSTLSLPCANVTGGTGQYKVVVDDYSGFTIFAEEATGDTWLRDPFGVVPDTCWWLPLANGTQSTLANHYECVVNGLQDGTCDPNNPPTGFDARTPGIVQISGPAPSLTTTFGVAFVADGSEIKRIDLTPSSNTFPDESARSMGQSIGTLPTEESLDEASAVAATEAAFVVWSQEEGALFLWSTRQLLGHLPKPSSAKAPRTAGTLVAEGLFAAIGTNEGIWRYDITDPEGSISRDKVWHSALDGGLIDITVHPETGTVFALTDGGVISLLQDGSVGYHPTAGGEGLLLGRPNGIPTPYVWGNLDNHGVLYRLSDDNVSVQHDLEHTLLGAGVGRDFQEFALVSSINNQAVTHSLLDQQHLSAIPDGHIGLAMAAFIETPRDDEILSLDDALSVATEHNLCKGLSGTDLICCIQEMRADFAEPQLSWLDSRLDKGAAIVLGLNPSAFAAASHCTQDGDKARTKAGLALPLLLDEWLTYWGDKGQVSPAVLLHNKPNDKHSFWLNCPEYTFDTAPDSCWSEEPTEESQREFYQALSNAAQLSPWTGREPTWSLIGGAFEGASGPDLPTWPEFYGEILLPDGTPNELGTYFGLLAMDPRNDGNEAKELAPVSASQRAQPILVTDRAVGWDQGINFTGDLYFSGNTIALPWLYESRRSGLLLRDFTSYVNEAGQFETDAFIGDEHSRFMTHADFAIQLHYITTRVVAHIDTKVDRWWYFHLQNLNKIRETGIHEGWITCYDDCANDTALDHFISSVESWPQISWQSQPGTVMGAE